MNARTKSLVLLVPVLLIALMLSSCGKAEEYKATETIQLLQGGVYYYEGLFYDGSDLDGYTIEMAVKGNDFVIAFSDTTGKELGRSVGFGGKGYIVDMAAKEYTRDTYFDDVTYTYSGLKFVESGISKVELLSGVNDKEIDYEEFEANYGKETGTIRFYFVDDKLYGIQENFVDSTGTTVSEMVLINKISSEIPEDWFVLPDDFKEVK